MINYNYKYFGTKRLSLSVKAVILNSRQSKYPVGNDPWVKNSIKAAEHISQCGCTLIASVGMNSWEIPLALAAIKKIPVIIDLWYQPEDIDCFISEICNRFGLPCDTVGIVVPNQQYSSSDRSRWPDRDRLALELADKIFPIAIRKGGNLEKLIDNCASKVDYSFGTIYDYSRRKRPQYDIANINPELLSGRWLVHFTRSNSSPWPGQSETEYYRSIIASKDQYCHSALETLDNIVNGSILYGSGRNLKNGSKAIGFTDIGRTNIESLFRYRSRLVNPGFEPYGIALKKEFAISIGIRPVIYGDEKLYHALSEKDRPYYQSTGKADHNWEHESEWRLTGNLNLEMIPPESLALVVPDWSQIDRVKNSGMIPVWPLATEK